MDVPLASTKFYKFRDVYQLLKKQLLQNCAGILLKPNVTKHNSIQFNPVIINACLLITIGLMIAIKKKHHTENDINQQGPRNLDSFWLNSVFASLAIYSFISIQYLKG